ncbi:hypothetical protein [Fulvimarina sp. MAC8]|uniref:hypothetical protein n=1 Tax=Fulvimarina sp. MAC8 TaxID=3162874 RepID=UPI0032EEB8B6
MSFTGKTILLLEDNALVSADLSMMIEDRNGTVIGPFRTCAEGLEALTTDMPDAALLDVELLDGASFHVAERMAADERPFIFYTAKGSEGYNVARSMGAPLLSKAHSSREAVDMLAMIVEHSSKKPSA